MVERGQNSDRGPPKVVVVALKSAGRWRSLKGIVADYH